MAQSEHQAIRTYVAQLLLAGTPVSGGRVLENRDYSLPQGVASQVHVNYEGSDPDRLAMGLSPLEWTTSIAIQIKARATAGVTAEDAADALWVDIFDRVMADQSLGGLAQDLVAGAADVSDATADTGLCGLTWRFTVLHSTANNTIAAP